MERFFPFLPAVCLVLALCVIAQFVLISGLNARFTRQTKMLRQFFSGPQGEDLEALLERTLTQSQEAHCNAESALERVQQNAHAWEKCLQNFALLRYDAFDDVTGEQSFSLALLDQKQNGTIITSLLGRQNSRCFGKEIVDGRPQQPLSDEEQRVLLMACQSKHELKFEVPRHANGNGHLNGKAGGHDSRVHAKELTKELAAAAEAHHN